MYQWLSKIIGEEYQFVKNLKRTDISEVNVYRNKLTQKKVIIRYITDGASIYEKLLVVESEYLPTVYEVARGEGKSIVVEEYIEGMTIGDVLSGGVYTEDGVKRIMANVCDALMVLHANDIIHRDIKPENIMITNNGDVKLIDFNASKERREGGEKDTRMLGTVGFAAPEQYGISQSDERSDIYALGVLINVMLTGEHPSKLMYSGRMKRVIARCVNISPDERYQSCMEVRDAIRRA